MSPVVGSDRTNYCEPADLIAYGVPESKATDFACDVASRVIDAFCYPRTFGGAEVRTETFDDVRNDTLVLPTPFSNVTAVTINGQVLDSTQYNVVDEGIRLYTPGNLDADGWPRRSNITGRGMRVAYGARVQVTATFGYTTIPTPVVLAAVRLASRIATNNVSDLSLPANQSSEQVEGFVQVAYHVQDNRLDTTNDIEVDRLLGPYQWAGGAVR